MSRIWEGRTEVPLAKPVPTGNQELREERFISQQVKSTPHLPHPKVVQNPRNKHLPYISFYIPSIYNNMTM